MGKGNRTRTARNSESTSSATTSQGKVSKAPLAMSFLSFIVAATSLVITVTNYRHQQKEELLVNLSPPLDSGVYIGRGALPSSSFGGILYGARSCLIANIGDRPLVVTSIETYVDVRKGYRMTPMQPRAGSLAEPISLKPGEAKRVDVNLNFPVSKEAVDALEKENLLNARVDRFAVMTALLRVGIDLQGKPIRRIDEGAGASSYVRVPNPSFFTQCVTVHTAKGEEFSDCVQFDPG